MSVHTLKDYRLYDMQNNKSDSIQGIFKSLKKIFDIGDVEIENIVNPWLQDKATELNNKITDIQYKVYEATGVEIKLTPEQLVDIIEKEGGLDNYQMGDFTLQSAD